MRIHTIRGLIERDSLALATSQEWTDHAVAVAMEWRLDGELVRRDVWVNVLRGPDATAAPGTVGE